MHAASADPGHPRLLVSTAPLLLSPLGWVLDAIADAGFEGVELLISGAPDSRDPAKVERLTREAGLRVPVVHGPYMLLLRRILGTNYLEKSRRALGLAAEIGAHTVVAHAPFRWERKACGWLAGEADAEAAEIGPVLAMENLYPVAGHAFSSAITPAQLSPFQHVVFDTSHFAVAGIGLREAWDAIGDKVTHIHLSDNLGSGRDNHAPVGSGVLPLADFLAHAQASGFHGTVTLELDCRAHMDTREALVAFLAGERRKVERLLAGDTELIH